MKRISKLLVCFLFFSGSLWAQTASKFNFSLLLKIKNKNIQEKEIAVFVKGNVEDIRKKVADLGGTFKYSAGDIAAVRIPLNEVGALATFPFVERIEDNDLKLQSFNDQMVIHNHVWEVQQGYNLPQGYDGSHVVVGIIDEGVDFNHPDFRDANGHTRLKFVWDQRSGPNSMSPQPYGYGREWVGSQIDTSTLEHDGLSSHGTHVTGTAAGNGLAVNNYKGIAPAADIIVVAMDVNGQSDDNFLTSLVDAVKYIFDKADSLNEPASINVSLGTYFGSHDAKDIQAVAIDTLIAGKPGRSLTCAAGNAGSAPLHLGYTVTSDTAFTWFLAPYSPSTYNQIYFEMWDDSINFTNINFAVGVDRVQPDHTFLGSTPFMTVLPNLGVQNSYSVFAGGNRIGMVETFGQYLHGAFNMMFLITPDSATAQYNWRLMTTGSGHFDAWSYNMVADNLPDTITYPAINRYKRPDLTQNIASSFTCSNKVITVGSYVNRNRYANALFGQTVDTTLVPGSLSGFSSHGPTRDGRIKPDVGATGEWVLSCGAEPFMTILFSNHPTQVAAGKKHFRSSGTSMASPVVAGIAALYFQRYPSASYADVKNAIMTCADMDSFTGFGLPDNNWGSGKVNAYAAIHGCSVGIDENNPDNILLMNYPNPFSEETTIHCDLQNFSNAIKAELRVYDVVGHELMKLPLKDHQSEFSLSKNQLTGGVYFYSLMVDGKILRTNKLIVL